MLAEPRWLLLSHPRVPGGGRGPGRREGPRLEAGASHARGPRPPGGACGTGREGRAARWDACPRPLRCRLRGRGGAVPSARPLPRPPSADTSASHSAASTVPALPALCLLRLAMCSPLQRCSLISAASPEFCQERGHGVILVFLPPRACEECRGGGIVACLLTQKVKDSVFC